METSWIWLRATSTQVFPPSPHETSTLRMILVPAGLTTICCNHLTQMSFAPACAAIFAAVVAHWGSFFAGLAVVGM